jgi:AcrR family transcriptional regulator
MSKAATKQTGDVTDLSKNDPSTPSSEMREHILAAALMVFSRLGVREATTRTIAREAGVSEVTLFRHFKGKEDLVSKVLERSLVAKPELDVERKVDQRTVLRLLSKFDLSAGAVAEIFAEYLNDHPPKDTDLDALRRTLKSRATEAQKRILDATGPLLTSEEIADRLGYSSGRRMSNNMKRDRELLAISVAQKRGDYFPEFQLEDNRVRPWIQELLRRIPDAWSALAFLTARRESLEGQSFLDVIRLDPSRIREMLESADSYVS